LLLPEDLARHAELLSLAAREARQEAVGGEEGVEVVVVAEERLTCVGGGVRAMLERYLWSMARRLKKRNLLAHPGDDCTVAFEE
jgi:hypothetical protein